MVRGNSSTVSVEDESLASRIACEINLIASMVVGSKTAISDVSSSVFASDFVSGAGAIFTRLIDLHKKGEPVGDVQFILTHLTQSNLIGRGCEVTVVDFARACTEAVPSNTFYYAQQVVEFSMRTELAALMMRAKEKIRTGQSPFEIAEWLDAKTSAIKNRRSSIKSSTIYEAGKQAIIDIRDSINSKRTIGVSTGILALDELIGGLMKNEMCIIAARPSCGKTSLGMQVVLHNAIKGRRVLVITLEMSEEDLALRALLPRADVSSKKLRSGAVTLEDVSKLERQCEGLKNMGIEIVDGSSGSVSVSAIQSIARIMQASGGLDLIMVDYISLIEPEDGKVPRHEQVAKISKATKAMAKSLGVPVLMLSQLSREAGKERPRLGHLRESGAIEQDADVVILIDNDPENDTGQCGLIVAKNRNGGTGTVTVGWDPSSTRFLNISPEGAPWKA